MATGDRRLGSSARRGMTVLGKIPAVPKPINLPSQRLENRGIDTSVEIVPRGTFSWGTGRSPPTSGSSWGNVGLSSSPPVGTGAWNTASTSAPVPNSSNSSGAQNPLRPLSAGSTRPSSAGTSRPLSASTTSGRAWGGAAKLEEQVQPSRFNLTTAEFPTLGSEKNPNLRPQKNTVPFNRPTSADAMKERQLAFADHYQSGMPADRPTSADGSKDWKPVYPGAPHAERPTSADGTYVDKGRQQPALRLSARPQFPDGSLQDHRHPFYTGVVGHGTAGPGPGTLDRPKDNFSNPLPVQHGMAAQGREFVFPGASQHDPYFNRPGGRHGNDVVVLPLDARPEVYGSYAFDSRPNHPDMSRAHHPQPSWGPNHLDRPGIHQGQFLQPGPAEHFHIMQPQRRHIETAVLHEQPVIGNRRDGFGIVDKAFGEQRAGWGGTNVVYMGSSLDARESSMPMTGTGPELSRPDMFLSSWGHQPMHAGWGNMYGGDITVGMYHEMPSSVVHQQATLIEALPQGSDVERVSENRILEKSSEKRTVHTDEVVHLSSLGGHPAAASCNAPTLGQDMQYSKQEETVETSSVKVSAAGPRNRNNTWASGGSLAGTQPSKVKQGDEGKRAEQNREAQKNDSISSMAFQRQEANCHGKFNQDHFVAKDGNNGSVDDAKATPKKKVLSSHQSTKGMKDTDSFVHEREERRPLSKAFEGTPINRSNLWSPDLSTTTSKESENALRDSCTDGLSKTAQTTQINSPEKNLKVTSTPNCFETPVGVPVLEEEKVPVDDGSKTKRNGQSVRRGAHPGRPVNESHSVDRQHVNHGMVWAPKPTAAGATKEEIQPPGGDVGVMHESKQKMSADLAKKRRMQPLVELESQGESQVQHMQSALSSQQGRGQQVQEHAVVNSKRPVQQRGDRSSKKQGHRVQQQQANLNVFEQPVQEEQLGLLNSKNQSPHMKHQQSVISSHVESAQPESQVAAISQREAMSKPIFSTEEAEKDGEVTGTLALDKFEGKKNKEEGTGHVPKPARNQHHQHREQAYEVVNNHYGQRSYPKGEKSVAEDLESPASETSALSWLESRKNHHKEVKARNSRNNLKQQKGDVQEPVASLASGEGYVLSGDRPQVEVRSETGMPSLAAEMKVVKDKEERIRNQKIVRQQEVHIKQSATGSHQEHRHLGEEPKPDTLSCESTTIRNEKKLYVPKQARKHYLQQECEATGFEGQGRQQMIQEVHLANEKGYYDDRGSQPSGPQTSARKNDMERYTPVQARQSNMQGQQSATRGQRGQRAPDLTGVQATRASSGYVGSESSSRELTHIPDSIGKGDESQPYAMGHRDEWKLHESSEYGPSKKEAKHYVVKSGGQQQQLPLNVTEEAPVKEERWSRSHRTSATESVKRKEGMKLYTVKHARQEETSVALDGGKEAAEQSLAEQHDPGRNAKEERTREFDHSHKNRYYSTKGIRPAPFHHSQKRNQPPLEDRNDFQPTLEDSACVSRVDETNGNTKGVKKDVMENPNLEDAEVAKPRHYQRRQYQYQPVAQQQSVKPQAEESNAHRPNTKQVDHGHNRYERREGPRRGRGHAYGYRGAEPVE